MSADKSQRPHEADREPDLPIEDLSAEEVEAESADQTRGGNFQDFRRIKKTTDKVGPA